MKGWAKKMIWFGLWGTMDLLGDVVFYWQYKMPMAEYFPETTYIIAALIWLSILISPLFNLRDD